MKFLRVVEVLPPTFPSAKGPPGSINLTGSVTGLVKSIAAIRGCSDLILVADVKNPDVLKLSSIHVASVIQRRAGVKAAPVITVRDSNRPHLRSTILTAFVLGLDSLMLVWGDRYPASAGVSNVYDYDDLTDTIADASRVAKRAGVKARILTPVTLTSLASEKGVARAKSRLDAGADFLLAQPPTTDSGATFEYHLGLLESSGLRSRVLLNTFPFRDSQDVRDCELYFGWKLPRRVHELAMSGRRSLLAEARAVAWKIRESGLPGVYVSTRGRPILARTVLGQSGLERNHYITGSGGAR